jgi:hypothetical protein
MFVVGYENGTLTIEFFLYFRRLFFNVFPFPPSTDKLLGGFHVDSHRTGTSTYNAPILMADRCSLRY